MQMLPLYKWHSVMLINTHTHTPVFPIHRPMCGTTPQNRHRAPQIDSASFFSFLFLRFLNINIVPFIHLLIALFLPDIVVHTCMHTWTRTHRDKRAFMPAARGCTYKQRIRPLLLSTRLSKGNPKQRDIWRREDGRPPFYQSSVW